MSLKRQKNIEDFIKKWNNQQSQKINYFYFLLGQTFFLKFDFDMDFYLKFLFKIVVNKRTNMKIKKNTIFSKI